MCSNIAFMERSNMCNVMEMTVMGHSETQFLWLNMTTKATKLTVIMTDECLCKTDDSQSRIFPHNWTEWKTPGFTMHEHVA